VRQRSVPSSLIKPDVPISGIRLSDWFHRKARGGAKMHAAESWHLARLPPSPCKPGPLANSENSFGIN
jgi:hypothetical protein